MTQETRRDLRFPLLAVFVVVAAAGMAAAAIVQNAALSAPTLSSGNRVALVLLVLAIVIAETLDVAIPGAGAISMSYPLYVATAVYFGPLYAGFAALAAMVPVLVVRRKSGWAKLAFNTGQLTMTAMAPGLLFIVLGGHPLVDASGQWYVALVAAGSVGTLVNLGLGGLGVSFLYGEPVGRIWSGTMSWMLPSQVVLGFVGLAIGEVLSVVGAPGFALFIVPLIVARQTYQQSVRLREAYADTISSLVAALEAKDLYTKGHSVRVAQYAVVIAESMEIPPDRVRRIEYAALLHDIGKVGVSRRVLAKESRLTEDEYEEIKRHPRMGAHIVADVPYLADLVPFIEHHHERMDGHGYGDGVAGDAIPFEARILAVADSYDAMTSVRPYRAAMSHEDALEELYRGSGTQFDPEVVLAFVRGYQANAEPAPAIAGEALLDEG
jgi:putative nucleotidyltransferase with HDIG domain